MSEENAEMIPMGTAEKMQGWELLGQYDAPAYIRRARGVERALADLLARCRKQREDWLKMTRLRLAQLRALTPGQAGDWSALARWLDDEQLRQLEELHAALSPRLRLPIPPSSSPRVLRRALEELIASLERFNHRWLAYLAQLDVSPINQLREGYNRYYLLEKECALRSSAVARQGYRPLPPLTPGEVEQLLPALFVPRPAKR